MAILLDHIENGRDRLLGIDPSGLEYLQGYVCALQDVYRDIKEGALT